MKGRNLQYLKKAFRGELMKGRDYVGHIFKVAGGYSVFKVEDGFGYELFDGRVFKGSDFVSAGRVTLSASRSVNRYEFKEGA